MEFTKKEGYAIQIGHLLSAMRFDDACRLSEELLSRFPQEPLSHFMAAKSYFLSGDYANANLEGRKAYNLSAGREDLRSSAIVTASALLMLGRCRDGLELLAPFKDDGGAEVKKLMVMLSVACGEGERAGRHFKELYDLNSSLAADFVRRLAKGRKER